MHVQFLLRWLTHGVKAEPAAPRPPVYFINMDTRSGTTEPWQYDEKLND